MKKLLSTFTLLFAIAIFSLTAQTRVYPPTLIEPEDGDVDQMPNVILNWTPVAGIHGEVHYDVELDTDAGFSNPATFQTTLSAVRTSELLFNHVYYWRVKATDGPDVSDWSETWSFHVINLINLKKPDDNILNIPPSQLLTWDTLSGVTHYDIQLDTSYFWKHLPDSTDANLNDIYFTSGSNGWIVGDNGTFLHVESNIVMLYPYPGASPVNLYGVGFSSADFGIAVGAGGAILYYDGTDWTEEAASITTEDLNDVHVLSQTDAWAVGNGGTVLHYNGADWTSVDVTSDNLYGVAFADASNGWVVGAGGSINYYNGTDWVAQDAGTKDFFGVYFMDASHGWTCSAGGKIWAYDGTEWNEMITPSGTKDLHSIFFTAPNMGYAIGKEGNFLQYFGIKWYKQALGINEQFNSIFFSENNGYMAGAGGNALYNDGSGFSSMHNTFSRNADSGAYVTQFMHFGAKYFWRVRARHSKDTTAWSVARAMNTIANVTLESPNNNATDIGLSDEYVWDPITGILTYEAQFADNENFSNPYIEFTEATSIFKNNLFFGVDYHWRVRANHATDTSAWSEVRKFTTINTVHLSSPANGATDIGILPTLVWEPISGIDMYQVAYDTLDLSNPCCIAFVDAPDNLYRVMSPMINAKTYHWHVRAINGADTTDWSAEWSFTIEPVQGIDNLLDDTKIHIYPNPSTGNIYLEYETNHATVMNVYVMDLVGQVMVQKEMYFSKGKSSHAIDLGTLANGIYILRYQSGNKTFARKITLNR